jgi:hypothetical protein
MSVIEEQGVEEEIEQIDATPHISLELGDIIEIIAPQNRDLNCMTAYIVYIDPSKIKVIDISTRKFYQLNISEEGMFTDESITEINLLSRSDEPGYARQNKLLPKTWVNIYFGGELPTTITGEISNLEEDMIEVTTYPDLTTIYINFDYQGIPENIPIEKIVITTRPESLGNVGSLSLLKQGLDQESSPVPSEEASIEFTDSGESIISIPENAKPDANVRNLLSDMYIDANTIVFGERLEDLPQLVEVPEGEQRFSIDVQVNDLLDELLSTIPLSQRTKSVMDNIHLLIERFKELRVKFSKFDKNENVYDAKLHGQRYKPLVDHIENFDRKLSWIMPVVVNRRKLYDVPASLDSRDVLLELLKPDLTFIQTTQQNYYNATAKGSDVDYSIMQRRIQTWFSPVELPGNTQHQIVAKNVMTDLDTIVDNLEDFYSSIFYNSNIVKRQYIIQRYNLGLSQLKEEILKSGKKIYHRVNTTPNEKMSVKSILMLPAPVMRFSTITLPTTTLLERSELHKNYFMLFRFFRKNTNVVSHVLNDLSKELDYDTMEKESKEEFLSGVHEFLLDKDVYLEPEEKFRSLLETIIPNTRFLVRLIRKYVKDQLTLVNIAQKLEPFMVYSDDLSYGDYKEIRFFIIAQITELRKTVDNRLRDMVVLRNAKYVVPKKPLPILRLLTEKEGFADSFFQAYKFLEKDKKDTTLSSQEILFRMTVMDYGNLYTTIIASIMFSLITPNNIANALAVPEVDDATDLEKIKPQDCSRRFLAKKYSSIAELQKHNNEDELFYDSEFDDSPYQILDKYKSKQKTLSPEEFSEFLISTLIHVHDCPPEIAEELATTLIAKKKLVKDGDYAILELKPRLPASVDESTLTSEEKTSVEIEGDARKKTQYYRRLKNNWVKDADIDTEAFIDTNTLFCNVSQQCLKNESTKECETLDATALRMKQIAKRKMMDEFDKRITISVDEIEETLEKNIAYYLSMLKKVRLHQELQTYKANHLAYELGTMASKEELLQSPYVKLRDLILGQDDFVKKQRDLCQFVEMYTRTDLQDSLKEDPNWLYCKDTNTKLLPVSIYELALEYISGGDYTSKLDYMCNKVGMLSDDGESIVDKHSGYVLKMLDFNTEEGFTESGFRISTHEILEKDLGTVILENLGKKEKPVFESELSQMIYNVFSTICGNIDVIVDGVQEFVIRVSSEVATANILSKAKYESKSEASFKKTGKHFKVTYEDYNNETLIFIVTSVLLVAIQTAIPSVKTNRTFPGCKRSFSGYPMDGIEDTTGIEYLSCVLFKSKSSIPPWKSIHSYKQDVLSKRVKTILQDVVMKRSDLTDLYVQKREYGLLNPELISPEEHSVELWRQFMPPLVRTDILKQLRNVASDFESEMVASMQQGSPQQHVLLNTLRSRILFFGYGLIEATHDIVRRKETLLRTSTQIPFLENACCNSSLDTTNPLRYFIQEDESIRGRIQSVLSLCAMNERMRSVMSDGAFLYHPAFTGIRYPTIPAGQLEENIYAAVFWYCNFDRHLPIPESLKVVCSEKPAEYKSSWSIQEKMEYMKKNGKRLDIENLHQLMQIVRRENIVSTQSAEPFTQVDAFKSVIDSFDAMNSTVIEEPLREHLKRIIEAYSPKKMVDVPSKELDDLSNYLSHANNEMYREIMDFFDTYGSLSNTEFTELHNFLSKINKWSMDVPSKDRTSVYDEGLSTATQYIQNAVQSFTKVYPTILFNNAEFFKTIPKHWGLSDYHRNDIAQFIGKYYKEIEKFKGDSTLLQLLELVSLRLNELLLFVETIPIFTDVVKEMDVGPDEPKRTTVFHSLLNKTTLYQILSYCFYSVFYEYIQISDDPDMLRADLTETKLARRALIREGLNEANQLQSADTLDEELQEIEVVTGNKEDLKQRVCSLLLAFIDVERENKEAVNFSYEQVVQRVRRSKEKEKKNIIKYLGDMNIEERKIEDMFKNYRLGRWNVGQQKGLVEYDKETYDRERQELLAELYNDVDNGGVDVVDEMRMDIYELDRLAEQGDEAEIEDEMYNIGGLDENFNDGVYYDEDREENDFGDES